MSQKVSLMFFKLDKSIPLVSDLWAHFSSNRDYEVISMGDDGELSQYLMAVSNGILFFKVMNKDDLQNAILILREQKRIIKKGLLRPVCIIGIRNKKIEQILAKNGCMDLLDPILKAKTVIYKIDMWTAPIVKELDELERQESLRRKHRESLATKKAVELAKKDFIFEKAMEIESDFWILKRKGDCKKVLNNYLLKFVGPSPKTGHWLELAKHGKEKDPIWKYVVNEEYKNIFLKDKGTWFFNGSKPEFDWKIQRWTFSGEKAHLYFYFMDGRSFSRFHYEETQLVIAENSKQALNCEEAIIETCDEKYNIENDRDKKEEAQNLGEDELKLTNDVSTQIKLDKINLDNLSGSGKTDHLDQGPLSGKAEAEDALHNMSGKGTPDHLHQPHLSGAIHNKEAAKKEPVSESKDLADPFAGFDPHFNPFTLPSKNQANLDFASDPTSFQTQKQKKPKTYMDLSKYMSLEGEEDQENSEEKKERLIPLVEKSSPELEENETLPEIKDVGFGSIKQAPQKVRKLVAIPSPFEREEKNKREHHENRMLDALGEAENTINEQSEVKFDSPFMDDLKKRNATIGHEREQAKEKEADYSGTIGYEAPNINLESGELKVVLKQKTNIGNDITFICKFEDFYEDELIVRAPKNSLAVKSEVFANVSLDYNGTKIKVISFGSVTEVEEFSEYAETLVISLKRVDSEKYKKFMKLYQERQEIITEFMSLAKGY